MAVRKAGVALALLVGGGMVIGEEPVSVTKPAPPTGTPPGKTEEKSASKPAKDLWLGIEVSKAAPAVHAQLKGVPRGVGFVIDEVISDSPAAKAGLRDYDYVWKMEDQLLINTAQFWTLLNMHEAGDTVVLTVQRGGEDQLVDVVVGVRPEEHTGRAHADSRIMEPSIPGLPTQIHDLLGRVAELRDSNGTVRVWRRGDGFGWAEYDEFDLELRSGVLSSLAEDAFPPDIDPTLKRKLEALVRGYQQAERNQRDNGRVPRIRRLPVSPVDGPDGGSGPE